MPWSFTVLTLILSGYSTRFLGEMGEILYFRRGEAVFLNEVPGRRKKRPQPSEQGHVAKSQNPPPHSYDGVGGRTLFWAHPDTLEDGLAAPNPSLAIHRLQNFFVPLIAWVL